MIQSKTAYTYEIDDVEVALEEIREQLGDLPDAKHMVGIVMCSYDYIESGVVAAISGFLPCGLVGETTLSQATNEEAGLLVLTLMLLCSDDCTFSVGASDEIPQEDDMTAAVAKGYKEAAAGLGAPVRLVIAFPPLLNKQAGDHYVRILSALAGDAPVFGSICADDKPDTYDNAHTILNDQAYPDKMTLLLVAGNVEPEFMIASVPNESLLPYRGEITKSRGSVLMGINDMSTAMYLETIGLADNGKIRAGISSIPFLINYEDQSGGDDIAVARAMYFITEDNYAVCGGEMPVGASITVGVCDANNVLQTTSEMIRDINAIYSGRSILMFSCLGRRIALGASPLQEVETAKKEMSGENEYMLAYSSGEICPTSVSGGRAVNRFHNYTIVACIL